MESASEILDKLSSLSQALKQSECEILLKNLSSLLDPSQPSGKELMDELGWELPKVIVQYVGVSRTCHEISTALVQSLAATYDPAREMFTALFEAINIFSKPQSLHRCLPLLRGLSIVFPRITRRTTEFVREAVPGLIEVGRAAGQEEVDRASGDLQGIAEGSSSSDEPLLSIRYVEENIRGKAINELAYLAKAIKGICDRGQDMQRLRDILGIFALQLLSVANGALSNSSITLSDVFREFLDILSSCNMTFYRLASTADFDKLLDFVVDEEDPKAQQDRLEARKGAALAVYWKLQNDGSGSIAEEVDELKRRLQPPGQLQMDMNMISLASNLLVHTQCMEEISLKKKGLSLMASILDMNRVSPSADGPDGDALELSIQIRPALQRLQHFIVYVPSPELRRKAYDLLIRIIIEVLPVQARFILLRVLISSGSHPSMISLLLACVKDEVVKAWPPHEVITQNGDQSVTSPFVSREVLEIIQCVLRTKEGEVAELPTSLDPVVSVLNLYRYILIKESTGKTNHTLALSPDQLARGRRYWLLPLRDHILRVQSAVGDSGSEAYDEIRGGLDLLLSVVYRCLEIVESF